MDGAILCFQLNSTSFTSSSTLSQEAMLHKKSRRQNTVYLKNGLIFSTGYSQTTRREYALWDEVRCLGRVIVVAIDGLYRMTSRIRLSWRTSTRISALSTRSTMRTSTCCMSGERSVLVSALPRVTYFQGDSNMHFFEVAQDSTPKLQVLSGYQSSKPQNGVIALAKLGVNVAANELVRLFKFHADGFCEVIPVICPRREQGFSEDVYPPTPGRLGALTVDEWMSGVDVDPLLVWPYDAVMLSP